MRKLKSREIKWLPQGHIDNKWPSQILNQGNLAPESKFQASIQCSKVSRWFSRQMRTNIKCKTNENARIHKLWLSKEEYHDPSGARSRIWPRLTFYHIISFSLHILAQWRRACMKTKGPILAFPDPQQLPDSAGREDRNIQVHHFSSNHVSQLNWCLPPQGNLTWFLRFPSPSIFETLDFIWVDNKAFKNRGRFYSEEFLS